MKEFFGSIEEETLKNKNFRRVLNTGENSQLVVMSLEPGEEIGDEVHPNTDQFIRIEKGEARIILDDKEKHKATDGDAVVIPAGTRHNVINTSKTERLQLYTIYSPPQHPEGTVHKTKAEAEEAEKEEGKK